MRLRNITGADVYIENSEFVVQDFKGQKGNWREVFGNDNPIHIEVGMGKGRFLMDMATLNPEINYVGIEMYSSVLLRAVQKMEENPLDNLRFIRMDAREIEEVFEEGEVSKIYLNFADPWPKDRHAKRRLPARQFLQTSRLLTASANVVRAKLVRRIWNSGSSKSPTMQKDCLMILTSFRVGRTR